MNTEIILINMNGEELKELSVKFKNELELYKKCNYRKDADFERLHIYDINGMNKDIKKVVILGRNGK